MKPPEGSRRATREPATSWWPVLRGLLLAAGWLSVLVLFALRMPTLLDWVSERARHGWLVPTLAGWAIFALPLLVGAAVATRAALLDVAGRTRDAAERFVSWCLIALVAIPTVGFLPGRLTSSRERWEHTLASGGFYFHRAVQWMYFGEFAMLGVLAFVVLGRWQTRSWLPTWASTLILLPPPLIMLGALLVAGR